MSSDGDARFWDKTADKYSKSPIADETGYERTLDKTRDLLEPESHVLELGCGTGGTAIKLAPGVRRYLATDISTKMIEIARGKNTDNDTVPGLEFRAATVEALAAKPARFNTVLAFNYLHLVRDLPGTLRSVHSLLAPGGLFISKTPCIWDMGLGLILFPVLPLLRAVGFAPFVVVFSAEDLKKRIEEAGFEIITTEYHGTRSNDKRPFIVAEKKRA